MSLVPQKVFTPRLLYSPMLYCSHLRVRRPKRRTVTKVLYYTVGVQYSSWLLWYVPYNLLSPCSYTVRTVALLLMRDETFLSLFALLRAS